MTCFIYNIMLKLLVKICFGWQFVEIGWKLLYMDDFYVFATNTNSGSYYQYK